MVCARCDQTRFAHPCSGRDLPYGNHLDLAMTREANVLS